MNRSAAPLVATRMELELDEQERAAVRAFNRRLARMPRFRMRTRLDPVMLNGLLRLSQAGGDARARWHGVRAETRRLGGTIVRVLNAPTPPRGIVLHIHGGGWVVGNARMDDPMNIALVRGAGVTIMSVDYATHGPAPIPRQMAQCLAAARALLTEEAFAGLPLFITGESAGGHLAAATLLGLSAAERRRFAGAIFYYGVFDLTGTPGVRAAGAETLVLHGPSMVATMRQLAGGLADEELRQAPLSPLHGDLSNMPPALFFGGALDPLLDDTRMMAARWAAHAAAECHILPDAPHGYLHFPTPLRDKARERARDWIEARIGAAG